MKYILKDTLMCADEADSGIYIETMTLSEWRNYSRDIKKWSDFPIDLAMIHTSYAIVYAEYLAGYFDVPSRIDQMKTHFHFAFVMDEGRLIFINDDGYVNDILRRLQMIRKWKNSSLERFLYDFLEEMIGQDSALIHAFEKKLNVYEDEVSAGNGKETLLLIHEIRGELLDLRTHYNQLIDIGQELEENENEFFARANTRFFRLFQKRVERLKDMVIGQKEYCDQIKDLYQTELDIKQNRLITVLTVISTIFMPLTLIAGWYGMNFKYMPEFDQPYAYPILIVVCITIVICSLIYIRKKEWL